MEFLFSFQPHDAQSLEQLPPLVDGMMGTVPITLHQIVYGNPTKFGQLHVRINERGEAVTGIANGSVCRSQ